MPHESRMIHFYTCDFCGAKIAETEQNNRVFRFKRGQYNEDMCHGRNNRRFEGHAFWMCLDCEGTMTFIDLLFWLDKENGVS